MRSEVIGNATLYLGDCMEYMATLEDNAFDLAIVDPPYGMERKMDGTNGAGRIMRKFRITQTWDIKPNELYFKELFRVSENQIIWGLNNFIKFLNSTTNYIFWYKHQPVDNFADGELAWTSFKGVCKCYDSPYFGAHGQDIGGKIHPTQKPVALYQWLLNNYAKPGQRILDTHLGSGSSAIAANRLDFKFTGIEIDQDYFEGACERVRQEDKQLNLFKPEVFEQTKLNLEFL